MRRVLKADVSESAHWDERHLQALLKQA